MKSKILFFLFLALTFPYLSFAQGFVNLTPVAKTMSIAEGELVLPVKFAVNAAANLTPEMKSEVQHFVDAFNTASGYHTEVSEASDALIKVKKNENLADEGYKLSVLITGVTVEAKTDKGLFYAFQSIKKMLPANVMAGVKDASVTKYALPLVNVDDAPRYGYRGFMLDTSRHFFSVKELKRVLDVMAYYKMNTFHWHITDDHGWRVEIKKYPRLTSVGSVSKTSYMVDMKDGEFWLNKPYGPYFYTQQDVKDIVAYAKERHISIVPEIDMPGHFSAAMAAYPEYSCDPMGSHEVITERAGVFKDVLNVGNPDAVQFAKDILTEIMTLFPGEQIHIGGDECPTDAWKQNKQCQDMMKKLGLGDNWRGLQSHFIKEMADHVKSQGRKLSVWNESITANGALTDLVKESGATVYCWEAGKADNAAQKATSLGLPHIYTPQPNWYIQRKQSTEPGEPIGAGNGSDNLEVVYNKSIPTTNAELFKGVQACFWSEYVAFNEYLEYLMLPRLVAVAEAGWSPQEKRVFSDFQKRISADAKLFDYNHYNYGKHYMSKEVQPDKVMPEVSTANSKHWYRIVNRATDERANKCVELLGKDAAEAMNKAYAGKGAQENRLWTNEQKASDDAAIDYQLWSLEESSTNKGHYALVCKAFPKGSVKATATGKGLGDRWDYDTNVKYYDFILGDYGTTGYGKDGEIYYYSIRSDQYSDRWMNASKVGQGYALNLWSKADDQAAGLFNFVPVVDKVMPIVSTATSPYWYRMETCATDANRNGRCIQLVTKETAADLGGVAGQLWTNKNCLNSADANVDYQYWGFEQNPLHADRYALVCKAQPNGSVSANPTAQDVSGRWNYDNETKHYNFVLADNGYGKEGDYYYYSVCSDQVEGQWMNAAAAGQKYAVNLYSNLADGTKAGYWKLVPEVLPVTIATVQQLVTEVQSYLTNVRTYTNEDSKRPGFFGATQTAALLQLVKNVDLTTMSSSQLSVFYNQLSIAYTAFWDSFGYLEKNQSYQWNNSVEGFDCAMICDNGELSSTTDVWTDNAWTVTESTINDNHSQTVKLQNVQTKKFIGAPVSTATDRLGYAVGIDETGVAVVCTFDPEHRDFVLSINGKKIFPGLADGSVYAGSSIQDGNAARQQGAAWLPTAIKVVCFDCVDQDNKSLGSYRRSWPLDEPTLPEAPTIRNFQFVEKTPDSKFVYKRIANVVQRVCRDQYGAIITDSEISVPLGQQFDLNLPYYTFVSAISDGNALNAIITPVKDMSIEAQYTTTAKNGIQKIGKAVSSVVAGRSYVLYDATDAEGRSGYRMVNSALQVNRSLGIENVGPNHTWILEEAEEGKFKVKNDYCNRYVPELEKSKIATMSEAAGLYSFTYNPTGKFWEIKGKGEYSAWNGNENGFLVGWNGAHPTHIFEYYAQPYFKVNVEYVDADGKSMENVRETWIKAGEAFVLNVPAHEGYTYTIQNGENIEEVSDNLNIKVIYNRVYAVKTTEGNNLKNRAIATFSAEHATTPSITNVEAFWTKMQKGNVIALTPIEAINGRLVIPANVGVVLSTPIAQSFDMVQTTESPAVVPSTNLLCPTGDTSKTVGSSVNAYILSKNADGQIMFFSLSDSERIIGANKSYLVLANGIHVNAIDFDFGDVTGIENILSGVENPMIYDLSGRRVSSPIKGGVYIKNGKKIVIK